MKKIDTLISATLRLCRGTAVAALGFAALAVNSLDAQDPRLTSLLDTRTGNILPAWGKTSGHQIGLRPVINDHGMVAFSANFHVVGEDLGEWWQVYVDTSNPGFATKMNNKTSGNSPLWSHWSYAIDNSNNFLWMNDDSGYRQLATTNPSTLNNPTFYPNTSTLGSISGRSLGMNNNGFFAFRSGGGVRVYDSNTETTRTISTTTSAVLTGATSINDHGKVVFTADDRILRVHDWYSNTTTVITPAHDVRSIQGVQPVINNYGMIAFYGEDAVGSLGLYTIQESFPVVATLVHSMENAYFSISVNDSGYILFADTILHSEGGHTDQLLLWDGVQVITLLSTGDTFNGSIVDSFDYSSYALNERGEVVFGYTLADGTQGVGYIQVPEPAIVALLVAGALFGVIFIRRKKIAEQA